MCKLKHSSILKSKHCIVFSKRYPTYHRAMLKIDYEKKQRLELSARIKEALSSLPRGGKVKVANACGVSTTAITGWIKTGRIGKASIEIVAIMTGYRLNWLITGKGPKLEIDYIDGIVSRSELPAPERFPAPPSDEFAKVKYGSFRLQAGCIGFSIDYTGEEEKPPLYYRKDWLISEGLKADNLVACKVKGDSMEPGLYDGDTVLIDTGNKEPKDGFVSAINYEGELLIKRMLRDSGQWWLQSDNPDKTRHPNKLCSGDYCIIIGRVVNKSSSRI